MKNDMKLRQDVMDELAYEPSISANEIGVAVKDGVVTLSGAVGSYAQKRAAEHCAERVSGVRALADALEVRLPNALAKSDTDIARAAANALDWDIEVPDSIKVRVENCWLYLDGSATWQFQKAAAERAVRYLTGVRGVTNLVTVKPSKKVSEFDVSDKIRAALRRTADLEANKISVETADGKVTLRGTVRSWAERDDAERAAWSALGVRDVEDRITIGA
ncbi:MAG TPA: BON domain-containing protein [Gemmatimonadaceae bacterium]